MIAPRSPPDAYRFCNLGQRKTVLNALSDLPADIVANDVEVLHFIDRHALFARGIGYLDIHLLATACLTTGAKLWTCDKRLHAIARQLDLAMTA